MDHMIIKEEIRVPGTLPDTYLETFFLSVTDKFSVQERPLILVCPGGGYNHTSDREAEIVAMQFNAMGYHTGAAGADQGCCLHKGARRRVLHRS